MEGFNIAVKINDKTLLGRTDDSINITPNIKESTTKDDAGVTNQRVVGHGATISCSGLSMYDTSSGATTKIDRDGLLEMVLKEGEEAVFPLTYGASTGAKLQGRAIISSFGEDSGADGSEANWSVEFTFVSKITKVSAS